MKGPSEMRKYLLFLTPFTVFSRKVWSGAPSGIAHFTLMMLVIIGISAGYLNVAKFAV